MLAGWGRGEAGTEKGKGHAQREREGGVRFAEVISPLKDDKWHGTVSESQDVQEEKTWGTLVEQPLYPEVFRIATGRRSFWVQWAVATQVHSAYLQLGRAEQKGDGLP